MEEFIDKKFIARFITVIHAKKLMNGNNMTGKEALKILDKVTRIRDYLLEHDSEREAFYHIGILCEELANIVRIDEVSFNPTVEKEEVEE